MGYFSFIMNKYSNTSEDWNSISSGEAYRLKEAEFRGMVMQALKDIQNDIKEQNDDARVTRWISMSVAGASGVITSVLVSLGIGPKLHG